MKGNKVRYTCPKGHILIARIDSDEGYPPEQIHCMGFRCEEMAMCGKAEHFDLPVMVLRLPTNKEAKELDDEVLNFVGIGGLLLFKIGSEVEDEQEP